MERLVLTVILVAAVAILVRIVWRSVRSASDPSKPPSCAQCPFDSKCEMQDKPHVESCGSEDEGADRIEKRECQTSRQ